MTGYRYPGAQPFATKEKHIFFGRESDISKLFRLINFEKITILYSKSGVGKSSLINAGLIPKIDSAEAGDAITIRLGSWSEYKTDSPLDITKRHLFDTNHENKDTYLEKLISKEGSLWYHAKTRQINKNSDSLILIYDQFEELFSYSNDQIEELITGLNELLKTTIPQRFRHMLEMLSVEDEIFTKTEESHFYSSINTKCIFSIRADRMHLLHGLAEIIPEILNNCFELKSLDYDDAKAAMILPAKQDGVFQSPKFSYSDNALNQVLGFLQDSEKRIEAIQLQILCQAFEKKVIEEKLTLLDEKNLGNLEKIISNYYFNQISTIGAEAEQNAARILIEEGLVIEQEEIRLSLHQSQIDKFFNIKQPLLQKLVNCHLLRAEPDIRTGGYIYELSHDTLIQPVLKAKKARKLEEASRAEEIERKNREEEVARLKTQAEKERQQKEKLEKALARIKRQRKWTIILSIAAILATLVALRGWQESIKNEKNLKQTYENLVNTTLLKDSLDITIQETDINKLFNEASTFAKTGTVLGYNKAITRMEQVLKIDSMNSDAKKMLDSYQQELNGLKKLNNLKE